MVEGDDGFEAAFPRAIDHALVMIEHGDGEEAGFGLYPRPFEGKAVAIEAHALGQVHVLRPQGEAVGGVARGRGIDGGLDIFEQPLVAGDIIALHLMPGGGGAPEEALRETAAAQPVCGCERGTGGESRAGGD